MPRFRRPPAPPKLVLAVLPSTDDVEGMGVTLPREDDITSLVLLARALDVLIDTNKDISHDGQRKVRHAKMLKGALFEVRKLLTLRRAEYYETLVAGVGVRTENLGETIRLTDQKRSEVSCQSRAHAQAVTKRK